MKRIVIFISEKDILNILQEHDIEGYLSLGAPLDEYEREAKGIFSFVKEDAGDFQTWLEKLEVFWALSFDLSKEELNLRKPNLLHLAEDLWDVAFED
jgi:hypothetical protein